MPAQFLENNKIVRVSSSTSAGTSDVTTSVVDMTGYDEVTFVAHLGTVVDAAVITLTTKMNTANSTSGATTITNGASTALTASTSSNLDIAVNVAKPTQRYVFAVLTRATQNVTVQCIDAILSKATGVPVTQGSTMGRTKIAVCGN